jgi:putative addiction module component (TIGR02574 family)
MTVDQLEAEALALPKEDLTLLVDRLMDSLEPAESDAVRKLWVAEALRRRDEVRSGRVKTIPGTEALAQVRRAVAR